MRDKVIKFFQLTGIDKLPDVVATGYAEQIRDQFPNVPDDELPEELKSALGTMKMSILRNKQDLVDRIIRLYELTYTEQHIDDLITFYTSETGRRVVELGGVVLPGVSKIADLWTTDAVTSVEGELSRLLMGNVKPGVTAEAVK